MVFEKFLERLRRNALQDQLVERLRKRRIADQPDELPRQARRLRMFDQVLLELRLLDLLDRRQHAFDAAIVLDQLGRCLRTNAGNARHIVHAVAHQSEDLADLLGTYAELLMNRRFVDAAVVHRVEHVDGAILDQLHQVLVGADDRYFPAGLLGRHHVAGDDVVRLKPRLFDAGDREGPRGDTD